MNQEVLAGGKYVIQRRLATGGMGEVLLAQYKGDAEISPGLLVVKRILSAAPGLAPAENQVKMLLEEGRLGMRLSHENLVETFRLDSDGTSPLLVIELLSGRSMAQVLGQAKKRREMVPADVALVILRASCCGLHFAHTLKGPDGRGLGLVHRDVSPANIFVTFDSKVKVIDFGVAKSEDSEVKTATGILKGKLGYMSPEQSLGETKLTPQADVWSLGVFFWEMLLADRLFSSPNPTATLLQISQKEIVFPRSVRPELPPEIDTITMKMLAREREQRYRSCADVVRAIDAVPWFKPESVDVGSWLSGRFPEEAAAGAADAAKGATRLTKVFVGRGLQEGSTATNPEDDDELATTILPTSLRDQLLSSSKPPTDAVDDELATVRVTPAVVAELRRQNSSGPAIRASIDDEDEIATRRVDADIARRAREPSLSEANPGQAPAPTPPSAPAPASPTLPLPPSTSPSSKNPVAPRAPTTATDTGSHRRAGMHVSSSPSGTTPIAPPPQRPATVSATVPVAPAQSTSAAPPTRAARRPPPTRAPTGQVVHRPSWLAIAVGTFGALVVSMGVAFSFATPTPPRQLFAYVDAAGYHVIVGDHAHAPAGRLAVPLDPQNALLLRAGTTEAALADAAILEADLRRAGVWDRAALPATSKAKTAALLPVIIIGIGLLALAFAIPSVLLRGGGPGRLGLQAGLTIIVVAAIAVMIQGGALSWPGYASFDAQPKLEWR